MKKWSVVLLLLCLILAFIGCKPEQKPEQKPADEPLYAKPVIYLYPEEKLTASVSVDFDGVLTVTYPAYKKGWQVDACPDGTLIDPVTQREYYCLFWEGDAAQGYEVESGFVVPGTETAAFLEAALEEMGLTDREANEFMIYWLPRMEHNPYNLISFQNEEYARRVQLQVSPEPDSILRVYMVWKGLDEPVEIPRQTLPIFRRTGFAVVEWGGTELN